MKVIEYANDIAIVDDDFVDFNESPAVFFPKNTTIAQRIILYGLKSISPLRRTEIRSQLRRAKEQRRYEEEDEAEFGK